MRRATALYCCRARFSRARLAQPGEGLCPRAAHRSSAHPYPLACRCGTDAVYLSYDIDSIEAAFVPGTGWPEPGGLLPREALKLVGLVAKEGLCGMEIVEVSPPYDVSDITSLMALRIMVDTMGALVAHGKMGAHKHIIDKPFVPF